MLSTKRYTVSFNRDGGFSMIELLLALLIGTVIIGGVMSLYVSTRDTQRASDEQLDMISSARFVIDAIGYDLRHASLWGGTSVQNGIACATGGAPCTYGDDLPNIAGDCDVVDYANLARPVYGADDSNPYAATCAQNSYKAGTDILQVRYADSADVATASLEAGRVYIRSNFECGKVFVNTAGVPLHDCYKWQSNAVNDRVTKNYPLVSHVYYVSDNTDGADGVPSLRRVSLEAGPAMVDDVVVQGVEDLQVLYGIVGSDGKTIVSYVTADSVPDDEAWQKVSAVKVYVLMRSLRPDRDGISGTRQFNYAGKTADETDGYRRFLVSSVIHLRNTDRVGVLNAAGENGP